MNTGGDNGNIIAAEGGGWEAEVGEHGCSCRGRYGALGDNDIIHYFCDCPMWQDHQSKLMGAIDGFPGC